MSLTDTFVKRFSISFLVGWITAWIISSVWLSTVTTFLGITFITAAGMKGIVAGSLAAALVVTGVTYLYLLTHAAMDEMYSGAKQSARRFRYLKVKPQSFKDFMGGLKSFK